MSRKDQDVTIANGIRIVPIETPTLGDRTYVVRDGTEAFVVDPQRTSTGSCRSLTTPGCGSPTFSRPTFTTTI
jgi:hypothetical protein